MSLKRHNFLRISIRKKLFIYLQSIDIFKLDYEKIFIRILNIQLGN